MSTKDQLLYSALDGTAMRYAAERRDLAKSIAELRQIADGNEAVPLRPRPSLWVRGMRCRRLARVMSWSPPER
jgi:hypothetical protein